MKEKLYKFMQGRYGFDALSQGLIYLCLLVLVINVFLNNTILSIITFIIWIIIVYRILSKNIYKRYNENQKYLSYMQPYMQSLQRQKTLLEKQKDDPEHKYFRCPECKQLVRVPRHKGKITITCPKCQRQFDRKS